MQRTWERVLGIIGVCADGLTVVGGLFIWIFAYTIGFSTESGPIIHQNFFGELIYWLSFIILFFVAISLICFILALVGLIKLKNNPKLSGYLFLIAAGLSGFISIFFMFSTFLFLPQAIAYLIAGILCLRNKSRVEPAFNA